MTESAKIKLQQALILLLDEKEFERISVSQICKEAGVHRSTFYSYYDNQIDLLEDAHLVPYLTFVKDHQKIYRIYLSHEHDFQHKDRFDSLVATIFTPQFHAHGVTDPIRIAYMVSFFMAGISQIISRWLRNDCAEPIEEIVDIIQTCIPKENK